MLVILLKIIDTTFIYFSCNFLHTFPLIQVILKPGVITFSGTKLIEEAHFFCQTRLLDQYQEIGLLLHSQ